MCERVFSVSFGPGLDSVPAAWLALKKLGGRASGEPGIDGNNLHSPRLWRTNHVQAVSVWCWIWSPCTSLSPSSIKLLTLLHTPLQCPHPVEHSNPCFLHVHRCVLKLACGYIAPFQAGLLASLEVHLFSNSAGGGGVN